MESRCGESSYDYAAFYGRSNSVSSESRKGWGESRVIDYTSSKPAPKTPIKYNNLREIDDLIERLEESIINIKAQNPSTELNTLINSTKDKITTLKQLVEEARKKEQEQKLVELLKSENEKIDAAIVTLKKGFK